MKKYLLFNFKTNPANIRQLAELLKLFNRSVSALARHYEMILFPSALYLSEVKKNIGPQIALGAQNIFWFNKIPATGEITPLLLRDFKVLYVIIGHPERRYCLGETNQMINLKIKACLSNKLIPILCVGEKEKNKNDLPLNFRAKQEIFEQLNYAFRGIKLNPSTKLMIAYEPVWAIGKGIPQNLKISQAFIDLILFWLARRFGETAAKKIPVLYGGSVNSENIKEFLSLKNSAGVLIGSAATNKNELAKILKTAVK